MAACHDVTLTVRRGEFVSTVGESGSAKSTLARLALGLEPLDAGMVRFDGHDLSRLGDRALRRLREKFQPVLQTRSPASTRAGRCKNPFCIRCASMACAAGQVPPPS